MTALDFWYEFASSYSYPAAMRIADVAAARGVTVTWRPFLLGPIFAAQGWRDSPFNIYPAKGRYMWRDLARIAARERLAFKRPSRFPRHTLAAARVALVGVGQGWVADFSRRVYAANFAEDREISEPAVLAEILTELGLDTNAILEQSRAPDNKTALRDQITEAETLGIFGAPSFTVGQELFWGNDRLEEAVDFAAT